MPNSPRARHIGPYARLVRSLDDDQLALLDLAEAVIRRDERGRIRGVVEALRGTDAKTLAWMEADADVQVFIEGFRQDVLAVLDAEEVRDA